MSQDLVPLSFPLRGTRLIEASAGTGKTWTIAALYVRLILGHGGGDAFHRPLLPAEILVMTFTRAATRELSDRIRERLVEAASCFRGLAAPHPQDSFLADLINSYPPGQVREQAAHRLMLAAEAMDEAAIFTIDAWCQRMLREHAFDSGCLFDEELVASEDDLYNHAIRDYWREQVYALDSGTLASFREHWTDLEALNNDIKYLVKRAPLFPESTSVSLAELIRTVCSDQEAYLRKVKHGWLDRATRMQAWMEGEWEKQPKCFSGTKLKRATVDGWFSALRDWAADMAMVWPDKFDKAWERLTPAGILDGCNKGYTVEVPADFEQIAALHAQLSALEPLQHRILRHAAVRVAQRMAELKQRMRQFGFADMLSRLKQALQGVNGQVLANRITTQFPVALIDEFQDTSPDQYQILDLLYRVRDDSANTALLLIGDPKQAIYGFRGADIHSYLAARQATLGRHYRLGTNFRSTDALVQAVNHLFLYAEGDGNAARGGHPEGAFRFRKGADNPLPFDAVAANGRKERLVGAGKDLVAATIWVCQKPFKAEEYRTHFAAQCAQQIVTLLNDPSIGFAETGKFVPLKPADIAVLVRDRYEAAAVRRALEQREVHSVYLSDKDSVFKTQEAADMLRWLHGIATPLDARLARAAFATATIGLPVETLAALATDDLAWEARVEQLKGLRQVWQRQGILAMLRRFMHELDLPATLIRSTGGERPLTNLLHLAELLQAASQQLDGEQALLRWLAEQIESASGAGEEQILRLESDADLVKIVTVHKSKGLEYPLVFLPFAASAKPVEKRNRSFFEYTDDNGTRQIDLGLGSDAMAAMDRARLEEDLRLLYVALTRARHALWLGVASLKNKIHQSAFGYLLAGGAPVAADALMAAVTQLRGACPHIDLVGADDEAQTTPLARVVEQPPLPAALDYRATFERNWTLASYTSITRDLGSVAVASTPLEEKIMEAGDEPLSGSVHDEPWHRFPRGALPGQFLHAQLEWLAGQGFHTVHAADFASRLRQRCERAGWEHRQDDTIHWVGKIVTTVLPPLGIALARLVTVIPEMEFWVPVGSLNTGELDTLCRKSLLSGIARPPLQARALAGMLRGFQDLVLEHDGRYWVLDYKSNALGSDTAAYTEAAVTAAMAAHRYDVQGAIYLLALHRLLRNRLGSGYDPARHLGGAVFYFLRGVDNETTRGCYHLTLDAATLDALEHLLLVGAHEGETA